MRRVFTTGTFDILHYGHISFLRRAKALGDYLIVGVNVNPEGKTPFYSFEERREILLSIKYVNEVVPLYSQQDKDPYLRIASVFACGAEYRQADDIEHIKKLCNKVVFLDRTPEISTTKEKEGIGDHTRFNTLCIDVDDTISFTENRDFEHSQPNLELIKKINAFHQAGGKIILSTARGAKSCKTLEERIAKYDKITRDWLDNHGVQYDELWFGKPNADYYIDDKNMSIDAFLDFKIEYVAPIDQIIQEESKVEELKKTCITEDKIDIIVPGVNENDTAGQKDFNYYKELEVKQGIQQGTNAQAFGKERIRDGGVFKYGFRGVEKNCPGVNKVFLVVQRESQLPEGLNRDNPKLRIVYHDEFIPAELLPTFSTLVIETFYYRIPDLSNHFIVSNDDFYFLNPIPNDLFFKDGKVHQGATGTRSRTGNNGNGTGSQILRNNCSFIEKFIVKKPMKDFIHYSHLPDGRVKEFEIDFMSKYYAEIYAAMSVSRFRHPENLIPSLLFIDTMKYTKYGVIDCRVYKNSCYAEITSWTNYNNLTNKEMVCINDTAASNMCFEEAKKRLIAFLDKKFPDKCSFEK